MPVAAAPRTITFTPEEYFDWEERQDVPHEYANGEVYEMPGGTYEHFVVIANGVVALRAALDASTATVLPHGMRLQIHDRRFVYPDVSVVVGEPRFREGSKRRALLNPAVVVEVLSENRQVGEASTASYDRGEKYALYREVRSLREIVWVDSERRFAEVAFRANGAWSVREPVAEGLVSLPSLGIEVAVEDLYRGVDLT